MASLWAAAASWQARPCGAADLFLRKAPPRRALPLQQGNSSYPTPTLEKRDFLLRWICQQDLIAQFWKTLHSQPSHLTLRSPGNDPETHTERDTHTHRHRIPVVAFSSLLWLGNCVAPFSVVFCNLTHGRKPIYVVEPRFTASLFITSLHRLPREQGPVENGRGSRIYPTDASENTERDCWGALMVTEFCRSHFFLHPNIDKDWVLGKL